MTRLVKLALLMAWLRMCGIGRWINGEYRCLRSIEHDAFVRKLEMERLPR